MIVPATLRTALVWLVERRASLVELNAEVQMLPNYFDLIACARAAGMEYRSLALSARLRRREPRDHFLRARVHFWSLSGQAKYIFVYVKVQINKYRILHTSWAARPEMGSQRAYGALEARTDSSRSHTVRPRQREGLKQAIRGPNRPVFEPRHLHFSPPDFAQPGLCW